MYYSTEKMLLIVGGADFSEELFKEVYDNEIPIIAADGGVNFLTEKNISPELVIVLISHSMLESSSFFLTKLVCHSANLLDLDPNTTRLLMILKVELEHFVKNVHSIVGLTWIFFKIKCKLPCYFMNHFIRK